MTRAIYEIAGKVVDPSDQTGTCEPEDCND